MSTPAEPDPRFRDLTPELLSSISADEIGEAVVQHVHYHLENGAAGERGLGSFPAGVRAVYLTWAVDVEVNTGGVNQLFFNRGVGLAGEALAGYELLGAEDYAAIMRAAIATFETERDRLLPLYERGTPDSFSESSRQADFGTIDQRYYALGDRIYTVWAVAVRDHPELFRSP